MDAVGYFSAPGAAAAADLRSQEARFYRHCDAAKLRPLATFSDQAPGPRPGFARLVQFLERAQPGVTVVVPGSGRLGASPTEVVGRILEIETLQARLQTVEQDPADLLAEVLAAAQRRRAGAPRDQAHHLQEKAMQAHGLGKPPFGYRIGPEGRFVVVPQEATVVQLIYRLYVQERQGLRLIAGYLNERGTTTRRGARWSVVTVRDILRNPVYQGTYSRLGLIVSGSHPAIVARETFRHAQERRTAQTPERRAAEEVGFALSGLVECGYCGSRMVGATRRQSWTRKDRSRVQAVYRYYRCGSRVNQSLCGYHTHRAEDLEAAVAQDVAAHWAADSEAVTFFALARARALREGVTSAIKEALAGRMEPAELRTVAAELLGAARSAERTAADPDPQAVEAPQGREVPQWLGPGPAIRRALLQGLVRRVVARDDGHETEARNPFAQP